MDIENPPFRLIGVGTHSILIAGIVSTSNQKVKAFEVGLPWQRVDAEALLDDRELALIPAADGACAGAKRYLEHWDQVALA
ncbi:MAG: hypothetical protein HC828_05345 [Blastochloris sp.]|nr:hypothetical protein [Blastochloris sp.]